VLGANWPAQEAFENIPLHNRWIYQSRPALPLETVDAQMVAAAGKPPIPSCSAPADLPPSRETKSGTVRIADSRATSSCRRRSRPRVEVKPKRARDALASNADEWAYFLR
jgi:oxalate decarboxylase